MQKATQTLQAVHKMGVERIPLTRIHRSLYCEELFLMAYNKIYRNGGALTPGTENDTADGMSLKRTRTTNLLERAFLEQRRRTNTIPRFFDERSCLKLVFATLWQASERWQNVRMSNTECALLDWLRCELKLDEKEAPSTLITKSAPVEAAA